VRTQVYAALALVCISALGVLILLDKF